MAEIKQHTNHQLYDNEVLAVKIDELVETQLRASDYMTIDTSLVEQPGMIKTIHTYSYQGGLQDVAEAAGNDQEGIVKLAGINHEVKVAQQRFKYQDEEVMRDPRILDVAIQGMADEMVNHLNKQFFDALATLKDVEGHMEVDLEGAPLSYDVIIDALAVFANKQAANEGEAGVFLLVNHSMRAELRKDDDFVRAESGKTVITGQLGTIAGVPVVGSRKVPEGEAYLMTKEAITCFVKKASEVEQEREANTRTNWIYGRKANVVALTDARKVVRIVKDGSAE